MSSSSEGPRPDPSPCREQDEGKFEILHCDGRARLGKLHSLHGPLHTPALLPVVNPNIRTIEPREMWDRWGIEGLITNSYIIWKHEALSNKAKQDGVHELLDFPGVVVCDSGTFQSYVYGDIEVDTEQIIHFQKQIGVDVATMLDVFGRPDMSRSQMEAVVETTIERASISLQAANGMMLNGPIQGGLEWDLRKRSAMEMSKHDFCIHPIGGIVPLMEQQRYLELLKTMLSSLPYLPLERPVHLFGCGHPMLFPMAIALGADLFDSAAYALFARDDRLLCPWGTAKLADLEFWPHTTPTLFGHTPAEVKTWTKEERTVFLARHNLEVTCAELDRCRQAIRENRIWELAERRSHQHPALREAFQWLTTDLPSDSTGWHESWTWLCEAARPQRGGGIQWLGGENIERPWVTMARDLLHHRWRSQSKVEEVLILYGRDGPWRNRVGSLVLDLKNSFPNLEILIYTPLGLLPWELEDLNPFAHIEGPEWLHRMKPEMNWCKEELSKLHLEGNIIHLFDMASEEKARLQAIRLLGDFDAIDKAEKRAEIKHHIEVEQAIARLALFANLKPSLAAQELLHCSFVHSSTRRAKNIILEDGRHVASPRLSDGGLSITKEGAKWLHSLREQAIPTDFKSSSLRENNHCGMPWIVVHSDAVPFISDGRNVFHGFILAADPWLRVGMPCLVVDSSSDLIGHGISRSSLAGMERLRKGVAVRIRHGMKNSTTTGMTARRADFFKNQT